VSGGSGTGLLSSSGGTYGALLGPERSGAGRWIPVRVAGFLWLFGCWIVDASIFYSCLLDSILPGPLWGLGWFVSCFVVFVCVATSYEGRMVDALASRADEGRRSLR
jgi:hypothetical protein